MAKQTFTTGQVLTAAQMTSLQQTAMGGGSPSTKTASYVLVAADAGTVIQMNAAGSTTITVNTALFSAGDSVQIQNIGAGVCTITAGTATVNTAGSLALSQWEGGFLYFTSASSAIFFDVVQSSGMTNPMTTAGDTIYGGASGTPTRLAIGSANQILRVNSGATAPEWATASSAALTLVKRASFSNVANTGTTYDDVFTTTYISYLLVFETISAATYTDDLQIQFRYAGPTTQAAQYYAYSTGVNSSGTAQSTGSVNAAQMTISNNVGASSNNGSGQFYVYNVGNSSQPVNIVGQYVEGNDALGYTFYGVGQTPRTYTGFILKSSSTNITGTVAIYGLAKS